MTRDPICGMTVDEATALRAEPDGVTFYFCSEHCRKEFLAEGSTREPRRGLVKSASQRRAFCGNRNVPLRRACGLW
jgi:YHS domain-containing protein